jgi:hypothetical protein
VLVVDATDSGVCVQSNRHTHVSFESTTKGYVFGRDVDENDHFSSYGMYNVEVGGRRQDRITLHGFELRSISANSFTESVT